MTPNTDKSSSDQPCGQGILIVVKAPVPSWNTLLSMTQWQRHKLKCEIQQSLLSALQAIEPDYWTRITWRENSTAMPADTLACYLQMRQIKRRFKSGRSRSGKKKNAVLKLLLSP